MDIKELILAFTKLKEKDPVLFKRLLSILREKVDI